MRKGRKRGLMAMKRKGKRNRRTKRYAYDKQVDTRSGGKFVQRRTLHGIWTLEKERRKKKKREKRRKKREEMYCMWLNWECV